jgi:predicted ester cyclase
METQYAEMKPETKALERRFFEAMNKGRSAVMKAIDEDCTANYVFHSSSGKDMSFKQYMSDLYAAFPDLHFTIDDLFAEGDKAVVRYTVTGTHKGAFMGIPPTNKKLTVSAIDIDRNVGGKWVESWSRTDTLGMMQQLGIESSPTPRILERE